MHKPSSKFFERKLSMTREKRSLDPIDGDDNKQSEPKRQKVPALASVIVEALKVDSLQKLCSSLEPILRRVVSEELERALAKLGPARLDGRSPPKQIEGPDGRNLQLHFKSRLSLPLFTGGKVEGEQGAAIHVVLLDANTRHVVTSGPESSAKLELVVLGGDFNNEDADGWTEEEFESHIVKEREGKRPLLTGDLQISLKEGVGTLGELTFTDNSSWIRSRKFRLGLKVASGNGIRVREAKTEAFTVKDHRGELYKKHYPPALKDEVWRLEKIGKDGSFHKRLNKSGIFTVEDFLQLAVKDSQRLRNVLGSGMSTKMWESLVEHAKTCVLSGKHYLYHSDETRSVAAVFNNIYEFTGLIANGQYYSPESLTDSQKVFVDTLVKKAYDNWAHAIEYDGKALLDFKQNMKASTSLDKAPLVSSSYTASYDQQISEPQMVQSSLDAGVTSCGATSSGGYNGNQVAAYHPPSQPSTSNINMQFDDTSYIPHDHFINSNQNLFTRNDSTTLALAPPQHHQGLEFQPMGQLIHPSNANTYDDFFSEEDIRMRSHEMLENEDMQHLLRVFSMGGNNLEEVGSVFPSYLPSPAPNYSIEEDRGRSSSGKAVVGWLKIKAAMRWGIFVRKKAAERRAQLVELEDEHLP